MSRAPLRFGRTAAQLFRIEDSNTLGAKNATDDGRRAALAGMNIYPYAQRDVQYAAPPLLAKWLESFKEFPPRARGASFSIDQVVEKLMPKA